MRALALMAVLTAALSGAAGCADEEAEPVKAARAYAVAVATGDVATLMTLVERSVVEELERAAEQASNQVGGRRNIEPAEMMQIVDLDPTFQIGHVELVSLDADVAQVEMEAADGTRHRLDLVQQDGRWRVRMRVPGEQTTAS